jgi:uncharacterized membrane protein
MNIPTKHCPQCGISASSAALFCARCGTQFAPPAPEPSSYVCEECDTILPGGSRFCPGCGKAFDTPVPSTEPNPLPGFRPQAPQPNPIPVTLHPSQPLPVSVQLKMPSFSHASGRKVNYGWIGESWALFQQKPGVWILATLAQYLPFVLLYGVALLFGVLGSGGNISATPDTNPGASEGASAGLVFGMIIASIPAFFLSCRLNYATFMMANKQVRGEDIILSDIFSSGLGMWPVFWLGIIWNLLFLISAILFYLPALIFAGLTLPCAALAAEGVGPIESLQRSVAAMKNDWLNAAGLVLLILLITLIGAIPCGLGLLAVYPMSNLIVSLACRDMIGLPSDSSASPTTSQSFASSSVTETPAIGESQPSTSLGRSAIGGMKATKTQILLGGTLLAIVFFAAGFGLIRFAHPQAAIPNTDNVANVASPEQAVATTASPASVVPADEPPASDPPAAQDDISPSSDGPSSDSPSSDEATAPPQTTDAPNPAPEVSGSSNHAAASTDDTMSAYAPLGSGLSDVPLSTATLQNEAITSDDLKNLSLRALSISHNSIYALHGYIFSRPAIQAYFNAQDWYHPDPAFSSIMLTSTEQQNVQTLRAAERANFSYGRNSFDEQGRSYEQRDPLRETAAPGSGLNDTQLDLNTLQHTVLTNQDLTDKSLAALSISYNAIYAAHGYVFKKASLQRLFSHAAWYHPNPAFQETDLTPTEKANLQTIRSYEHSRFSY